MRENAFWAGYHHDIPEGSGVHRTHEGDRIGRNSTSTNRFLTAVHKVTDDLEGTCQGRTLVFSDKGLRLNAQALNGMLQTGDDQHTGTTRSRPLGP